jgi:hypothetical protein
MPASFAGEAHDGTRNVNYVKWKRNPGKANNVVKWNRPPGNANNVVKWKRHPGHANINVVKCTINWKNSAVCCLICRGARYDKLF